MTEYEDIDKSVIETALELDASVLDDVEYLEQQATVETHYDRAAELYFKGDHSLAQQHEIAAYNAATYLRDMVVHDLERGSTWGRIRSGVLEE